MKYGLSRQAVSALAAEVGQLMGSGKTTISDDDYQKLWNKVHTAHPYVTARDRRENQKRLPAPAEQLNPLECAIKAGTFFEKYIHVPTQLAINTALKKNLKPEESGVGEIYDLLNRKLRHSLADGCEVVGKDFYDEIKRLAIDIVAYEQRYPPNSKKETDQCRQ